LCVYDLSCQPFNCKPGNNEVVGNYRWQLTRFNGSMVEGLPSTAEDMNKYGITSEGSLTVNKAILTDEGTYICTFESQGNVRLQEMSPYHCLVVISKSWERSMVYSMMTVNHLCSLCHNLSVHVLFIITRG
jgi:hypothetical protein